MSDHQRMTATYIGGLGSSPLNAKQTYLVDDYVRYPNYATVKLAGGLGTYNATHFTLDFALLYTTGEQRPTFPCNCGAMFALKALIEAVAKQREAVRKDDWLVNDALGRAQALAGMPPPASTSAASTSISMLSR